MPEVPARLNSLQNTACRMYFETMRLFVGVPVPNAPALAMAALARHGLAALADSARLRLTHPADFHITLYFLGETPEQRVPTIEAELRRIECPPFLVEAGALRVFARAGAVYLEVTRSEPLLALAEAVVRCMESCGFRREARPYHPHVTVARMARAAAVVMQKKLSMTSRSQERDASTLRFSADRFHLYRTTSQSDGPKYETLLSFPLVPLHHPLR